jgi:hypothetical protein
MTKVNKEKLVNEICARIYNNNKLIAIVHADDMEKCFAAVDLMKLAAFSAISILECFTANTNEELIIELAKMFEDMKNNILKEQNGQQK